MSRYQYTPLNEAANEIRLVTILPGAANSAIALDLHTVCFDPHEPAPAFEALSYTWGPSSNPADIQLGHARLQVTRNLEVALQHLRLADRPRIMWIDAVCVNQEDLSERSEQVKRMADIYSRARRVTVWLGPAGPHTGAAIRALNLLGSKIIANWSLWRTTPAPDCGVDEHHWADADCAFPFSDDVVAGIRDLYGREWFERLWIQQEIRMASVEAAVVCGQSVIPWTDLRKAALCMSNNSTLDQSIDKVRLRHVWSIGDLGYTNLPGILSFTRQCRCSDPRDRIFAVLSFLKAYEQDLTITPDYSLTARQVFQEAVWKWIEHNSALDVLTLCDGTSVGAGLPSWVPNLTTPPESTLLQTISTASARAVCNAVRTGDVLRLQGIHVATIDEAIKWPADEPIAPAIRRLAIPLLQGLKDTPDCETMLHAFCTTINAGLFSNIYIPDDKNSPNYASFRTLVSTILERDDAVQNTMSASQEQELQAAKKYCKGRSLLRTHKNELGLGPDTTQPGDIIAVLLGGRGAFALRPSSNAHFDMVGECYVHGYMSGEALLGPLPPGIRSIARYDEKTGAYWRCYLDERTGECAIEDPRLGPLPAGWRRKGHERDHVISWFVNDGTGEGHDVEWRDSGFPDPRTSAEAFGKRDVGLRFFDFT